MAARCGAQIGDATLSRCVVWVAVVRAGPYRARVVFFTADQLAALVGKVGELFSMFAAVDGSAADALAVCVTVLLSIAVQPV